MMTHSTNGGLDLFPHIDMDNGLNKITDKPEKITAGRLLLDRHHEIARLYNTKNKQMIGASWGEFQQLARRVLKDEIAELKEERDYWCEEYHCECINNGLER